MPRLLGAAFHINDASLETYKYFPAFSTDPSSQLFPLPLPSSSNDLVSAWSNPRSFHVAAKMFLRISTSIPHKKTKPEHERRPLVYPAATPPASTTPTPSILYLAHIFPSDWSGRLPRRAFELTCKTDESGGQRHAVLNTTSPRCPSPALASLARDDYDTSSSSYALRHLFNSNTLKDCGVTAKARRRGTPLVPAAGADALLLAERLVGFLLGLGLLSGDQCRRRRRRPPGSSPVFRLATPTGTDTFRTPFHFHSAARYLDGDYTRLPASDDRLAPARCALPAAFMSITTLTTFDDLDDFHDHSRSFTIFHDLSRTFMTLMIFLRTITTS
ncbi:hypothetical protein K438DRAFT_2018235 [Mycena galopus ATCC 62051]|nr:hypothetical protein K438DRAFT_2018235 [Mycena galopus ATCC 62051]